MKTDLLNFCMSRGIFFSYITRIFVLCYYISNEPFNKSLLMKQVTLNSLRIARIVGKTLKNLVQGSTDYL